MATHELYIGGPASANYSRSMFPAVPFNAADDAFKRVTVAAHKGPTSYALGRVLDASDHAFAEYVRTHTIAQGDVIGSILIPQGTLFKGFQFRLVKPQGTATLTLTPSVRGLAGATLPAIAANGAAGSNGYAHLGDTAWITANGLALPADTTGGQWYFATPAILDLTLTAYPASGFGAMRLELNPIVEKFYSGQY